MLFSIRFLHKHPSFQVNRHIYYFLLKIQGVKQNARFSLNYFRDDFKQKVSSTTKLKHRLTEFFDKFKKLDNNERKKVIEAFKTSQLIPNILIDKSIDGNEFKLDSLPSSIRGSCARLFIYLYETTLKTFKERHYKQLYDKLQSKICPFCGLEKLNSPTLYNQDYDHILYKGLYPLVSVNMRNLVPMGTDCNQKYKTTKDVLYDNLGNRRLFLDPYANSINVSFSLLGSTLPQGGAHKGIWIVEIVPDNEYTRTWNEVFKIKQRCIKNGLETFFDTWIGHFKIHLKKRQNAWNEAQVRNEMQFHGEAFLESDLDESSLLKGALFMFLCTHNDPAFFSSMLIDLNS